MKEFIKNPIVYLVTIPEQSEKVKALAKIGYENYQTGKIKQRSPGHWIQDTFGKNEQTILAELASEEAPPTYSLAELFMSLQDSIGLKPAGTATSSRPTLTVVCGLSVNDLHKTPLGNNCIVQLASQFDFQEAPIAQETSVTDYLTDRTQGPQGSIEAAAAACHRKAAKRAGKLPHALIDLLPSTRQENYQDGYLSLPNDDPKLLQYFANNILKLKFLPQWATCESSNATQLQVFCAAPANPAKNATNDQICELLVGAQYMAIAKLAVLRSRMTGQRVPLHLTLVGQGVFANPHAVMKSAMETVAEIVAGEGVDVYIHAFSAPDQALLAKQLAEGNGKLFNVNKISADAFRTLPHPAIPSVIAKVEIDDDGTIDLLFAGPDATPAEIEELERKITTPAELPAWLRKKP